MVYSVHIYTVNQPRPFLLAFRHFGVWRLLARRCLPGYVATTVIRHPTGSSMWLAAGEVKRTILVHPEFATFRNRVGSTFDEWRAAYEPLLKQMKEGIKAKPLIARISEDILERFATLPLLHSYDVYQRLMDYWAETMQDDVFLIGSDGWTEAAKPRLAIDNKERKIKETPDLVVGRKRYKMDLIPPALIVARYFAAEQEKVDALEAKREEAERAIEEFVEENGGEDGLLDDAKTENGSVTKASVKEQLTKLPDTLGNREERAVLAECLKRIEIESEASREQRDAQAELDARVLMKYGELSTIEIKTLVVEDKWMDALYKAMEEEIERITRTLANRVQELEDRYAETLARVEADVDKLGARVTDHLRAMGMVLA